MARIGKIATLKKEFRSSGFQTMDSALSNKGMSRIPGTGVFKYPYREITGQYRTGLDPNASYIKRIKDEDVRKMEIERVTKLKERLEGALNGIDLSPTSKFWNSGLSENSNDQTHVQAVKLLDGVNLFNLDSPFEELAFSWLRVHPTIASSHGAWERGEYPAETQFYVADEEVENTVLYKKKQKINKAIVAFQGMSLEKRKKVARLLGLPIIDDTSEEVVYNLVDDALKQTEFKSGKFKGLTPVEVFNGFVEMKDNHIHVKDLIKQAISHSVIRTNPKGQILKGELKLADSEEDYARDLLDDDNQDSLVILEKELKAKKIASV